MNSMSRGSGAPPPLAVPLPPSAAGDPAAPVPPPPPAAGGPAATAAAPGWEALRRNPSNISTCWAPLTGPVRRNLPYHIWMCFSMSPSSPLLPSSPIFQCTYRCMGTSKLNDPGKEQIHAGKMDRRPCRLNLSQIPRGACAGLSPVSSEITCGLRNRIPAQTMNRAAII